MPDLDLILLKIVFAANLGLFAIIWETEGKDTTTLPNSVKFTASVSPSSTIYPSTNLVSSYSSNMLITKSSTPRLIVGSTNSIESSTLDSKATMLYLTPSISELRTAAIKSSLPSPQQYITSPPNITGLFPSKSTPKIRPSESIVTRVSSFIVTSTIISTSSIVTKTATEKDTESTKQSTNAGNEFTDENNGLVIGLSVGLGAAAMIILVSLVVIWKKYKRDMSCSATSSKSTRSPATTSNAVIADDDEVAEQESTSNDKYRFVKDTNTSYAGIVNPVHVLYEENPDFVFI